MKRLLAAFLFLAAPLAAQQTMFRLSTQIEPGFGSTALGDTYYSAGGRALGRLAGNTTTTTKFKCQTGTGTISAAPAWCTLVLGGNTISSSGTGTFANKFIVQGTADAGLTGAQFLGALATGIVKNTTTTGVLSIAALADIPQPLTTKGDLPCWTTLLTRLGVGTNTHVLTADSAASCGFDWEAGGAGTVTSISTSGYLTGCSSPCTTTASLGTSIPTFAGAGVGLVPDATSAGAGTYLDKGGNFTTPAGSFTSPLTTKGDLLGYSTGTARKPVGTDGMTLHSDSGDSFGVSYGWQTGTMHVLKETVFAGITPASYSNGSTTTIDGSGYTCTVPGNGAVDMVATGLRLRRGTTSTTSTLMTIGPGNTGDFLTQVGEARFRRGHWAFWVRMASYDFTNTSSSSGAMVAGEISVGVYPRDAATWGVSLRRSRSLNGAPNTSTGGIAPHFWFGSEPSGNTYPGVSTADVWMAYFRDPLTFDIYYGTYSGGWPTMEAMTFLTTVHMPVGSGWTASPPVASGVTLGFQFFGTVGTTTGTAEVIWDRWRLTAWE